MFQLKALTMASAILVLPGVLIPAEVLAECQWEYCFSAPLKIKSCKNIDSTRTFKACGPACDEGVLFYTYKLTLGLGELKPCPSSEVPKTFPKSYLYTDPNPQFCEYLRGKQRIGHFQSYCCNESNPRCLPAVLNKVD